MIAAVKTATTKLTPSLSFATRCCQTHSGSLQNPTSFYYDLIRHCISLNSPSFAKFIHARLIKIGYNRHTFIGNCLVELYSQIGAIDGAFGAFGDVPNKNPITWNLLLMGFFKNGYPENARQLFDEMPDRDVVSWNSMISGYMLNGLVEHALDVFLEMQAVGMRPSEFTFSIIVSSVEYIWQGKQVHGSIIRSGLDSSNVVLGNSLIDMYGKLNLVDYAFGVFLTMEELDVVSWNSMISGCEKCGDGKLAFSLFHLMRVGGFHPDQFTVSAVITVCANLRDLARGTQVFAQSVRMGVLSNSIVSCAVIDMFAKCNRLEDSIQLFRETPHWDSALCNVMISGYARHGFSEEALCLFVLTLRDDFKPTEFTLGSILSCSSCLAPAEQGTQIHSLAVKLGSEFDVIVASSLVDMYAKSGLVDSAVKIFSKMSVRDLVCWNTMIMGFARNGRGAEALHIFEELCKQGFLPDRITLASILLACSHGGLVSEGWRIFSAMEEKYGVSRSVEHYTCIVDMLGRTGKLAEAMKIIEAMPQEPNASIWGVLLGSCWSHGDMKFAEIVAERMMVLEPCTYLPYSVLVRIYAIRGRWESVTRVRRLMKERGVKRVTGCSWIGIKNLVVAFKANQILYCGGEAIYSMLRLLVWEMKDAGYVSQHHVVVWDGEE
ncbi:hypothetical protein MRB53_034000 [Persea americana]|uniref:Uncharacterized protein n=1 Tax=Persea americana TaxID=3435 RepID=A0ACC2KWD3_PERAE|nr:hypothetical protein MRB53_034000 [Persea americana]